MKRKAHVVRRIGAFFTFRSKGSREQVSGILRFAATHPEWNLRIFTRPDSPAELHALARQFAPDGIITGDPAVAAEFRKRLHRRIPCVITDFKDDVQRTRLAASGLAFVDSDDAAIGRAAAELFLKRGYGSFGFIRPARTFAERERAFVGTLRAAGYGCAVYLEHGGGPHTFGLDVPGIARWLADLPKPCAVLAITDAFAQGVLDACREGKLAVPERVAVLGIDNDELICESTAPALSSIELDYVRGGFLAAETLDKMLGAKAKAPSERQLLYSILRTVERASTKNALGSRRRAVMAQELLRERVCAGVSVSELAAELNVSVRMLELDFRKALGHSMREEMTVLRLEESQRLLRSTQLPMKEIAAQSGFRSPEAFSAVFRRKFGLSPRAFRACRDLRADCAAQAMA